MLNLAHGIVGVELPVLTAIADRFQLREFARVVGITDTRYTHLDAAREAGYPDGLTNVLIARQLAPAR
jgi:hypothetical protein